MNINKFVSNFKNHPILFIGSGLSMRYLEDSHSWDDLLGHISFEIYGDHEPYLDIKAKNIRNNEVDYSKVASELEEIFERESMGDRNGKFKEVNDIFYLNMKNNIKLSRIKIYISLLLKKIEIRDSKKLEFDELVKIRKNISSVITTNYDQLIETVFEFSPLIGNKILMSNPYGSVYKIHGCVTSVDNIILTKEDYKNFENKYELIRAQLLSLFIHNPIIFLGYSVSDNNIRKILKTIFTYVDHNSEEASKIKSNFLIVEFEKGSTNQKISDFDIIMDDSTTITLNKLKTDDYTSLYINLAHLQLPVSAMDIRKVQNIVKEIYEGGEVKVEVVDDLDKLQNHEKVLAIGNKDRIHYDYQRPGEMMSNYFKIIQEDNYQLLSLIDKQTIQNNQYFPIYGFEKINKDLKKINSLKKVQKMKLNTIYQNKQLHNKFSSVKSILDSELVSKSRKNDFITYGILSKNIKLEDAKIYLEKLRNDKQVSTTDYRKILCAYDFVKYAPENEHLSSAGA